MSDDPGVQESKVQQGCARAPALCTVRHADRGSAEVYCFGGPELDFGQNLNGLAIVRGAKQGVHQFLYGHGQAETVRKIALVSVYPANALSSALSKLAKVELS
jgi:hypothetical protein